jgi:hypothetical protein
MPGRLLQRDGHHQLHIDVTERTGVLVQAVLVGTDVRCLYVDNC